MTVKINRDKSKQMIDFEELRHLPIVKIRKAIRSGQYSGHTAGLGADLVQGNLVILSAAYALDFFRFCQRNPKSCPLVGVSGTGSPVIKELGTDLDIRTDLPGYYIFENGEYIKETTNIEAYWHQDLVAFVLGCSFSFESALMEQGISIRNIELGINVSMFETNIPTKSTALFAGNMVVSMRPIKRSEIIDVVKITEQFPKAHGAPIHFGDPSQIGISDLTKPSYGEKVPIYEDEIPVFWGCGVTSQKVVQAANLPMSITHAPGKMLITDRQYTELQSI